MPLKHTKIFLCLIHGNPKSEKGKNMFIPDEFIQELKSKTDIVDVVSGYVQLKKQGKNMLGLCPFHSEKTPSFNVSTDKNFFHCFGCKASGDVITFIRRIENLDYIEAVKLLAQRAGLEIPEGSGQNSGLSKLRNRIYEANRAAARFYYKCLYSPNGKNALEYLHNRGLTDKTIVHFGLGYSPSSRFELTNYLKNLGFTEDEIFKANLGNKSEKGYFYDRFSDRVMFPIIDLRGNVVGFGGRIMSDIQPKYLNTSDTPAFNKGNTVYAMNFAKNKADGQMILAEGYMDVISLHQAGFENAVATLGTALTKEQAHLIARYCKEVVICYDADEAGQKATERAIDIFRETNAVIKVLKVPNGKDPDEFIKSNGENGAAKFRLLLDKCGNDVEYRIAKLQIRYDTDITEQKVEFLTEIAKLLASLDNEIERDAYISKISEEYSIDRNALSAQTAKYAKKNEPPPLMQTYKANNIQQNQNFNYPKSRAANAEEVLLALLMTNSDAAIAICPDFPPEMFTTPLYRSVYEKIKERAEKGLGTEPVDISGYFSNEENSRISSMVYLKPRENDPFRAVNIYMGILEKESRKLAPEKTAAMTDEEIMAHIQKNRKRKK